MPIIGVRPTPELKEFLRHIKHVLTHGDAWELEVTDLAWPERVFSDVSINSTVMEQHITEVLKGNQVAMRDEDYRTPQEVLDGEAKKMGLVFTRSMDRTSFKVRLATTAED